MAVKGYRRAARELALKMMFQVDVGRVKVADVLAHFDPDEEIGEAPAESIVYAHALVRGTAEHLKVIDRLLETLTEEWTYERFANVDRAILRLAVYELFHEQNVPEEVVINEAVELAKEYSTEESSKFVNGILGNLSRQRAAGTLQVDPTFKEGRPLPEVPNTLPEPATEETPPPQVEVADEAADEDTEEASAEITPTETPRRKRRPLRMTTEE